MKPKGTTNGTKAMAVPYRSFKQKINLMKKYQDKYYIENLEITEGVSGALYMTLREDKHEFK